MEAQERTVETAERGYKIVTARFLANSATQLEVNDAQVAQIGRASCRERV
jgi:outer membrane protein TolC